MALQIFLVALGCAVGGVGRFLLGKGVNSQPWADGFPWSTLLINIIGSFLLGIFAELYIERQTSPIRQELYLLLGTGFCGGFTTFSTFSLEWFNLLKAGHTTSAMAYILTSAILCLFGTWLGILGTKTFSPHP
ncbi:MAG: fluoride efflux transporter CrcB [Gemmataceae bacterium]|mgnify:FL=1|jgi:CrcB protein